MPHIDDGHFKTEPAAKERASDTVTDQFHRLYYESGVWAETDWLGVRAQKCPLDLWVYQEIVSDLRPDLIIECGTADGGSALFLASICDLVDHGRIITIDIEARGGRPEHPRISYFVGSSTSDGVVTQVKSLMKPDETVVAILDSDHNKGHVLEELRIYSELVTAGSYLIVEDTNINGHPVLPHFGPGPKEAVEEFLSERKDFVVDPEREKFYLTFNPRGYLRKL